MSSLCSIPALETHETHDVSICDGGETKKAKNVTHNRSTSGPPLKVALASSSVA